MKQLKPELINESEFVVLQKCSNCDGEGKVADIDQYEDRGYSKCIVCKGLGANTPTDLIDALRQIGLIK